MQLKEEDVVYFQEHLPRWEWGFKPQTRLEAPRIFARSSSTLYSLLMRNQPLVGLVVNLYLKGVWLDGDHAFDKKEAVHVAKDLILGEARERDPLKYLKLTKYEVRALIRMIGTA